MDDPARRERDRLPSIKQALAILAAGVLLFPGLCVVVMARSSRFSSAASTMMTGLLLASAVFTIAGIVLLLARATRSFRRH